MFAPLARMWCQRPMRTWNWLIWSCWWGPIQHGAIPLSISASWPLARSEARRWRSEEHKSELQSLMRNSYAVFCLQKKKIDIQDIHVTITQINCTYNAININR